MNLRSLTLAAGLLFLLPALAQAQDKSTVTGVPHWLENDGKDKVLGVEPGKSGLFLLDEKGKIVASLTPPKGKKSVTFVFDSIANQADEATMTVTGTKLADGSIQPSSYLATIATAQDADKDGPAIPEGTQVRVVTGNADQETDVGGWIDYFYKGTQRSSIGDELNLGVSLDDKATAFFRALPGKTTDYLKDHPEDGAKAADKTAADDAETAKKIKARGDAEGPRTGLSNVIEERSKEGSKESDKAGDK